MQTSATTKAARHRRQPLENREFMLPPAKASDALELYSAACLVPMTWPTLLASVCLSVDSRLQFRCETPALAASPTMMTPISDIKGMI